MRNKVRNYNIILSFLVLFNLACTGNDTPKPKELPHTSQQISTLEIKQLSYKIVRTIKHDATAFTQGLFFDGDNLIESTGLIGKSSLRIVNPDNGEVIKKVSTNAAHFGEGSVVFDNKIYMLTWQDKVGYVYDLKLNKTDSFTYEGEGWGLTSDSKNLILSDGTNKLRYYNPDNFTINKVIEVTQNNNPRNNLNELEYAGGFIYANVWMSEEIVKINPTNGNIVGILDLSELRRKLPNQFGVDVLNGIAYNKKTDTYYVTGKNWQLMFEIKISE